MITHSEYMARRAVLVRASLDIPGAVMDERTQRNSPASAFYRYAELRVEGDAAIDRILDIVRVAMESRGYLTMHTDRADGPVVGISVSGPATPEAGVTP